MEWSSFWSAVIGGLLVIAGHLVVHFLNRCANALDKQEVAEQQIATLALEVVNWFEIDTQRVIDAAGGPLPTIQKGHPVYALAASIRIARPDLKTSSADLLKQFREYYQVSRVLIPRAAADNRAEFADRITNSANEIMNILDGVVESVCD